ncbi:MAG: N-acetylmuramoyl-L-alanine amidase [Bacteroidales bacterium]|nr:N-acetylmuramoyl-L-alanine amidase [Bacteroidales bacterium]
MKLIPKALHTTLLLLAVFLHISVRVHSQPQGIEGRIRKIVLDAGHGGKDAGAVGRHTKEKNITLTIALKTGELIKKRFPDIEIIYTRKTDEFVELYKRAEIANKAHADLFVSIHCNSVASHEPYGTETFVMGLSKNKANLEVAKAENAAVLYEDNIAETYDGFNPYDTESHIIFTMYQSVYREQSLQLASIVQNQYTNKLGRNNRGVKEAGFLVLYKTSMPSILTEVGFISNKEEERFLNSENGQNEIAATIFRSVREYKQTLEKGFALEEEYVPDVQPLEKQRINSNKDADDSSSNISKGNKDDAVVFRVQFFTSFSPISLRDKRFKGLKDVFEYRHGGSYKYTAGKYLSEDEATEYRRKIVSAHFKDAFIVAFKGNERISIDDARKLSTQQ